jgi:hypothetical protein
MNRTRVFAASLALLAIGPPAPAPAAEEAGRLCRYYCETMNAICQAAAAPLGNEEACTHIYYGCLDGCAVPV